VGGEVHFCSRAGVIVPMHFMVFYYALAPVVIGV